MGDADRITKTFSKDQILDMLDDAEELETSAWRHGRRVTYLLTDDDGAHYRITLDVHPDEGIQFYGDDATCERVEPMQKSVIVWVPYGTAK